MTCKRCQASESVTFDGLCEGCAEHAEEFMTLDLKHLTLEHERRISRLEGLELFHSILIGILVAVVVFLLTFIR